MVIDAVEKGANELLKGCDKPNASLKSKAWNDKKVEAHHAIIPTEKSPVLSNLSQCERQVYLQVARQYLAQFYPPYCYLETSVVVIIEGGHFSTKAKQEGALGWKQLFPRQKDKQTDISQQSGEQETQDAYLPPLEQGQILQCSKGEVLEKQTQAPKAFNDASLLSAMTGISRHVSDVSIRKILKDTDGLGTEATRAGIIELLFKRGFLSRQGKSIVATDVGKGLINSLPESATTPDMTALWESKLNSICQKEISYKAFMLPLIENLHTQVHLAGSQLPTALQGVKSASPFKKGRAKSKKSSANRRLKSAKARIATTKQ